MTNPLLASRRLAVLGSSAASRRPAILPLALLALLLVAPAASAGEWVEPHNFPVPSSDYYEGSPTEDQIRYQNGGTATEAFLQINSLAPLATTLHVGTMPPGGGYADQLTIASTEGAIPAGVEIAVAPNGAAVAGWPELTGPSPTTSPYRFRAAFRPAGAGTWEAPVTLATEAARETALAPEIVPAISANGTAAVGVQYNADEADGAEHEPTMRVDVAVRSSAGKWSTERLSPKEESPASLSLAFDLIGNLTAAYTLRFNEGSSPADARDQVIAQRRPASSGVWGPLEEITNTESQWSADALQLGENEAGDAVLAYQRVSESPKSLETWAATRQGSNGPWTEQQQLVLGGSSSAPDAAGVAPNGVAYVLYGFQGTNSGADCQGVARAIVDHPFTAEHCVSPTDEDSFSASVAFLGNDAYFAWSGNVPGESHITSIQGARWTNGSGAAEVARNLDASGDYYGAPTLLEDRQGSVVAFYRDETAKALRAAAYDGGPPILLGASVPASATAGQPVTFSASLVDLWAGLGAGQPTWSFGDGSAPVGGAIAIHTFAAAGTYTVTLNATDALGNATTGVYTIVVQPAPAAVKPPPPPGGPPRVTLKTPSCPKKLSKKACKRRRASTAAWRTLTGSVTVPSSSSPAASVQVAIYLTRGKHVLGLSRGRFRKTTKAKARAAFVTAKVSGGSWSLKLPKLAPGGYTILVRASDAGYTSATSSRTVQLR